MMIAVGALGLPRKYRIEGKTRSYYVALVCLCVALVCAATLYFID